MDNILGLLFSKLGMLLGLIAVMAVSYAYFQGNKTSTATSDLAQASQGVQTLYGSSQFSTLTDTVVVNAKLAPPDMVVGTNLVNPWNGTVTFGPNANPSLFNVTETLVPSDGCAKVVLGMSYSEVSVNGTAITPASPGGPLDPAAVTSACSGATNTLILTFGH